MKIFNYYKGTWFTLTIFISLLSVSTFSYGQNSNSSTSLRSFANIYGDVLDEHFTSFVFSSTHNAYFGIVRKEWLTSNNNQYEGGFAKLDINGNLEWVTELEDNYVLGYTLETDSGDFLLHGGTQGANYKHCTIRMDANGNVVWEKIYEASGYQRKSFGIFQSEGDSYYTASWLAGSGGDDILITRIDGSGDKIWSKRYFIGSSDDQVNVITGTADRDLVFSYSSSGMGWDCAITKIDKDGLIEMSNRFAGSYGGDLTFFAGLKETMDGGYLGSTMNPQGNYNSNQFAKFNADGEIEWMRKFVPTGDFSSNRTIQYSPQIDANGNSYWLGFMDTNSPGSGPTPRQYYLFKLDAQGNTVYSKLFDANIARLSLTQIEGEKLIFSGKLLDYSDGYGQGDGLVMVLDTAMEDCLVTDMGATLTSVTPYENANVTLNVVDQELIITSLNGSTISRTYSQEPVCTFCNYAIEEQTLICEELNICDGQPKVCVPLIATDTVAEGIIGMDFCLHYDNTLMSPTGLATLGEVVLNSSTEASYAINYVTYPDKVCFSIYYTSSAPTGTTFTGLGEIACVEFLLHDNFTTGVIADFSISDLIESYELGIELNCAENGFMALENDNNLEGRITYWDNENLPLPYDSANPTDYLATNISGMNSDCMPSEIGTVQPDLNGYFDYNIINGSHISIERDIDNSSVVMSVVNGMDCYWTSLVTTQNNSFLPSPYQIIGMDVNRDGAVTAGDITAIQNRIVLNTGEFPQTGTSKDWVFIDAATANESSDFEPSPNYPASGSFGYHRLNVPNVPDCLEVEINDNEGYCEYIDSMTYQGILLGDVNQSWGVSSAASLRTGGESKISLNLDASFSGGTEACAKIPVFYEGDDNLMAMDLVLDYNELLMSIVSVELAPSINGTEMGMAFNNNINEGKLYLTSYSKIPSGISTTEPIFYIFVELEEGSITNADLGMGMSLLNGIATEGEVKGEVVSCFDMTSSTPEEELEMMEISIYPNPVQDNVQVVFGNADNKGKQIRLFGPDGRLMIEIIETNQDVINIDMSQFAPAVYIIEINGMDYHKVVKMK